MMAFSKKIFFVWMDPISIHPQNSCNMHPEKHKNKIKTSVVINLLDEP
jgi:hypothetical protein